MSLYFDSSDGLRDWFSKRLIDAKKSAPNHAANQPPSNIPTSFLCGLSPESGQSNDHKRRKKQIAYDPHRPNYID